MYTNVFILYHANCMDGLGAKYSAYSHFRLQKNVAMNYIPVSFGNPLPAEIFNNERAFKDIYFGEHFLDPEDQKIYYKTSATQAVSVSSATSLPILITETIAFDENKIFLPIRMKEVYILDFSYNKEVLEDLNRKVNKLVVLDHHKTAKDDLDGLPYTVFNLNKSGAVLAWEYFHPDEMIPKLLLHVQDRDLRKFKLSGSKEITLAFESMKEDMYAWGQYCSVQNSNTPYDKSLQHLKDVGSYLVSYRTELINRQLKNVKVITFRDQQVGTLNCVNFVSEVGHAIHSSTSLNVDYSMTYFFIDADYAVLSFRSKKEGTDVGAIAKSLGGGGHVNASGVKIPVATLLQILSGTYIEPVPEDQAVSVQ